VRGKKRRGKSFRCSRKKGNVYFFEEREKRRKLGRGSPRKEEERGKEARRRWGGGAHFFLRGRKGEEFESSGEPVRDKWEREGGGATGIEARGKRRNP